MIMFAVQKNYWERWELNKILAAIWYTCMDPVYLRIH